MATLSDEARSVVAAGAPGLQLIAWYTWVAAELNEDQRTLLSYAVSRLVNRGWLSPLPKLMGAAAESLGISKERLDAALSVLQGHGLIAADGDRITSLAGVISTSKTSITYFLGEDHATPVSLVGPLAALGIAHGLNRGGEVVARCAGGPKDGDDKAPRVTLICDESGIHSRDPESVALFLPSWDGTDGPAAGVAGGGLFLDDDALAAWQTEHDDPDGMPVTSMIFPMATTDLGAKLGKALESMFDHVANFA